MAGDDLQVEGNAALFVSHGVMPLVEGRDYKLTLLRRMPLLVRLLVLNPVRLGQTITVDAFVNLWRTRG